MTDRPCDHTDLQVLDDTTLVVVLTPGAFVLGIGHPMRDAGCLICRGPINGEHAVVIGVAGIGGTGCTWGCVGGQQFIAHSHCRPDTDEALFAALQFGLACPDDHPWD